MQLPLLTRTPAAPHNDLSAPLEIKLRRIHQRRRRAFIRRLVKIAGWGAAILCATAFVLATGLGTAPR